MTVERKLWFCLIAMLNLATSLCGQSYTYFGLSAKNQKQISNAQKNIEKNIEQEQQMLNREAGNVITTRLITLYRSRISDYRTIYETYASHNYEFWTKFKGDPAEVSVAVDYSSQARDIYIAALDEFNEAERIQDADGKLQVLKEACEKFRKATELIAKAYEIYSSTPLESDSQTKAQNLHRNDSLKKISQTGNSMVPTHVQNNAVTTPAEDQWYAEKTEKSPQPAQDSIPSATLWQKQPDSSPLKMRKESEVTPNQLLYASTDTTFSRYWVQIAACRVPLSKWQLAELVPDTLKVVEKLIDHWYKYRVGPFDYKQAEAFRKKCNVKGAFIIRYQ